MSPRLTPLALARQAGPLRRVGALAVVAGASGAALLGLAAPAWLARLGVVRSPIWVFGAWLLVAAAVSAALVVATRLWRGLAVPALAGMLDRSPGWRRGAISAVLQGPTGGTSEDLFEVADRSAADRVDREGGEALTSLRDRWRQRAWRGAAAAVVGIVLLLAAGPGRQPVAALWTPAEAWAAFIAPVRLEADRTVLDRGESVGLTVVAVGRRTAELWTRGKGETWQVTQVELDSIGRAAHRTAPLAGDLFAFVNAGGRTSDTVAIHVRLPAFLGNLTLTARYPEYLGLEDEPLPVTGDTLLIPAGTRLDVTGESTAELASATWQTPDGASDMTVDGLTFRGRLTPRQTGPARLEVATRDGAPLGSDPVVLPIVVVPDRAPEVEIAVPEADTLGLLSEDLALVLDVRDDHGLTAVALSARRTTRGEAGQAEQVFRLQLPPGTTDRALLSTRLAVQALDPRPGDTITVTAQARDNAPAGQTGSSRTLVLFVPTATEARAEQREAKDDLARQLDSLVNASRQLQRQTEDLSQARNRQSQSGDRNSTLGFDEVKKAEQVARDQQDLMDAAEAAEERLDELERAAERSGIADSSFQSRLDEIRDQLDKALTPELRKRLDELREALKNLDPQATQDALKNLAEAQKRLQEALERTRELFKRAALEGELTSLEQETKQLGEEQQAWNDKVERADSAAAASEEQGLAQRTDSLAQGLEQASEQLEKGERQEGLQQAADQLRQAADQMRKASKSASAGKKQQAKQEGQQAQGQLSQAQKEVEEQREAQQQEWRQEVVDALDRALAETARLSQRQLALSERIGHGATAAAARAEQASIEEGVQKVLGQMTDVSGKNALISPQIGAALVQARLQMARAREAISSASANLREAVDQAGEAVDALNVAAYQMLRSRDDVSGSSSASGLAEAIERMQQLAGQQGSLSQEGNDLLSMLGQPQFQQQLSSMAQRQRQLADELERLRAETQAPGTKDLAEEARELARRLEASRLDRETIDRQERLFRRMLDAGRTLQGEEKDEKKERESTVATGDSISVPAPLRLRGADGRIRLPSWEELQRLSPEERRLVTDYFRRLTSRDGGGR
ncbi:MAG: DUF4175 family protein [Gemmatimonadales bacterium]